MEGGIPVAEEGVSVAEAPATPAQQPSATKIVKEKSKEKSKEKAKERREKFKAAKAMRKHQKRLRREGDEAELRKAKNFEKKRRRAAAKAGARGKNAKADGFPMSMPRT